MNDDDEWQTAEVNSLGTSFARARYQLTRIAVRLSSILHYESVWRKMPISRE